MTGIGGDMFCLFYNAATKKTHAINGSGRSPAKSSLQDLRSKLNLRDGQYGTMPSRSPYAVTVPGTAAGWVDTVAKFGSGKLSMTQILQPAIDLGEEGFPVSKLSSVLVSTL